MDFKAEVLARFPDAAPKERDTNGKKFYRIAVKQGALTPWCESEAAAWQAALEAYNRMIRPVDAD